MVATKILRCATVFNIDNNKKYFLSTKLAYYNDFWRIMWHSRTEYYLITKTKIIEKKEFVTWNNIDVNG